MCDVCLRSTLLHFASSSTVVTSHLVFMLSGNHTVNQKIQLCLCICVFHCLPKLSMSYIGVYCIFCTLDPLLYVCSRVCERICLSFCECMY